MTNGEFLQTYLKVLEAEDLLTLISMAASRLGDIESEKQTKFCETCIHKISAADLEAIEQDAYQRGRSDMFEILKPDVDSQAYEQGRTDTIDIIFDRLHDFIDYSTENYGCSCFEGRSEALDNFETWLYEQYKGQNNE